MNCAEIDRLLPAFADGEFRDGEQTEVEIHLAHCDVCRASVAAQQIFRSIVKQKASGAAAPERLRARIQHDLGRARLAEQTRRYTIFAAMAAGLAGVASAAYLVGLPPALGVDDLIRVSQRTRDLPLDFDPAGGDPVAWTRSHVGFNPAVPMFHLRGVRILPVGDRDGAMFVYGQEPRQRSVLLVFPEMGVRVDGRAVSMGGRDVILANHQGFNVAVLHQDGLMYSLVSDLDEQAVLQILREFPAR